MRTDVLGVGFDNISMAGALAYAEKLIANGEKAYVVTPNPEIVWLCRQNAPLTGAVSGAGLVLADGVGITLAAKILGTPLRERIPGIDFISALFETLAKSGTSVYLLGAKPGVAETAGEKLAKSYPGLVIAGTADGYFTDDAAVIDKINSANPDVLLVCLGAPKQELWMHTNLEKLNVRLCAGLGGALDVFAGTVKRAPKAFRRLGLEWLYRLIREPRRFMRMTKLPLFLFAAIIKRIKGEQL